MDLSVIHQIEYLANKLFTEFPPEFQTTILIEEMSELTKVLCKIRLGKFDRNALSEEFTHVCISLAVVQKLLHIQPADMQEQIKSKLNEYGWDSNNQ